MKNSEPKVILCDVNETLLDMTPLKESINNLLNTDNGFKLWFGLLLQYSLVDNNIGRYHDFTAIADAAMDMAGNSLGVIIKQENKKSTLSVIKTLKAYPDVEPALNLLKEKGFKIATLTNSPEITLLQQIKNSNLERSFDLHLSVDMIKKYKPALETYRWAAVQLKVKPQDMVMIAAHGWDVAGAAQAGLKTAFVARPGQSLYPLVAKPDYIGLNLEQIADYILDG
ncbi:MAG: haloacid dehalogenase type II [Mucilaginibacter sp.]